MSTKLKVKSQDKHKKEARNSLRHTHLVDCCKKQSDCRSRRCRRTKQNAANLLDKNVINVIKSISGSSHCSTDSFFASNKYKLSRVDSTNSIIYVGTTYIKTEMPRKDSFIDLTKSDTTIISWSNSNNLDNFDISGDIIDEIHLKDQVSSAASIFTIYPPQPQNLFASPSDELCICQSDRSCHSSSSNKRNLSTSDISCHSNANKPKRVASSKSKIASSKVNTDDSSDCVWKLKRSYPLTHGLCGNNEMNVEGTSENVVTNLACDVDILDIVDDLEREFNLEYSQNSAIADEINALKLASSIPK